MTWRFKWGWNFTWNLGWSITLRTIPWSIEQISSKTVVKTKASLRFVNCNCDQTNRLWRHSIYRKAKLRAKFKTIDFSVLKSLYTNKIFFSQLNYAIFNKKTKFPSKSLDRQVTLLSPLRKIAFPTECKLSNKKITKFSTYFLKFPFN